MYCMQSTLTHFISRHFIALSSNFYDAFSVLSIWAKTFKAVLSLGIIIVFVKSCSTKKGRKRAAYFSILVFEETLTRLECHSSILR